MGLNCEAAGTPGTLGRRRTAPCSMEAGSRPLCKAA